MKCYVNPKRVYGHIDPMIYGHFIEFFHRQIYGGIYTVNGPSKDSYNDIGNEQVSISENEAVVTGTSVKVSLAPHSVNLIELF